MGMGRDLAEAFPAARETFEAVDDALGQKLSNVMFEGPEDTLTLTENAQPALMAVSLAVVRVLEAEGGVRLAEKARFVAGHSLGEYAALAAAGAFDLGQAARLLRTRGRAMQDAVPVGEGAMAAVLGLDLDAVEEVADAAAEGEVCEPANDNAPGQVVVSGHASAVARAVDIAKERGAMRAVLLPVSAPFHCALMRPAADAMAEALTEEVIAAPALPLVSNVTAAPETDPARIRDNLVTQVTHRVRWRESVMHMREAGVEQLVELGSGKVLSGLARRIDRKLTASAIATPSDVDTFLSSL